MLYVVATPIGNYDDITLRALETLRKVDLIASEDPRVTEPLLRHFDIAKPQIGYVEGGGQPARDEVLALIRQGKAVAIVSNAGTPGISDPALTLIRSAINQGVEVVMAPGPSAFVMALVLSGFPLFGFTFRGFTPRRREPRRTFLAVDKNSPHTLIFYEVPQWIRELLEDALHVFGDRKAVLATNLTRASQQIRRGTLSHLLSSLDEAGVNDEYTLVVAGQWRAYVQAGEASSSYQLSVVSTDD